METEVLVQAERLTRYYDRNCAVQNVSFELNKGDVLGFLGPNGAGKSTTMQMITGNLAPSAGKVSIEGVDLLDRPKKAKANIGYLPETPPLYRDYTVDEFLHHCARLHRVPRNRIRNAVGTAQERCGLDSVRNRLIGNLSKGFQQRVGIAQAILHSPPVVILDEPTVGLDPIQIREIRTLIRELGREHGIILSTHILPEVQATCNRVQIINQGRLVFSDSTEGLERQLHGNTLIAAFNAPPSLDELSAIPGVSGIDKLPDQRLRIHYENGRNPAETIAEEAVAGHWRIFELSPERRSLEQIFIELTCSEPAMQREDTAR